MVLTLCHLHWWYLFCQQLPQTSLAPAVVITCNLHWWCFSWYQLVHLRNNVHTWLAMHAAIANCYSHWWWWWWWCWWWWWLYVVYYYIIPENGSCYHHLLRQTLWWQKDQKMVHAITICWSSPHCNRKTRKCSILYMTICCGRLDGDSKDQYLIISLGFDDQPATIVFIEILHHLSVIMHFAPCVILLGFIFAPWTQFAG